MPDITEPLRILLDSRWRVEIWPLEKGNELHISHVKSEDHLLLNLSDLQDLIDYKTINKGARNDR